MVDLPSWVPLDVDVTQPSISRIWDWFLDGSHNFAVDRDVAAEMLKLMPEGPRMAQASRAFLRRAVRMCVESGITQFLDIGSGIPTVGNVHEIAQSINPACRVVYVDIDPVAVSHTRQILAGNERATVVRADLRSPREILAASELRNMLDFTRPIALMLVAILHFIPDSDDPLGIIRQFHDVLAPGSHLVIGHGSRNTEGMPRENLHSAREMYERTVAQVSLRSRPEVMALFEGWELVYPGVVWIPQWRPDEFVTEADAILPNAGYAGVAQKL
ncbi:MAG TPA: SAM-dependent methyltransferase [Pseudonocardiaceae bacterium]